jgi:hypothetical protein
MNVTSLKEESGILFFSASACLTANQQNNNEIPSHFELRIHRLQPKPNKKTTLSFFSKHTHNNKVRDSIFCNLRWG